MRAFITAFLATVALFFGGCSTVTTIGQKATDAEKQAIQAGINNYIGDFSVELSPWGTGGSWAQAAITNNSSNAYTAVVLRLALVQPNGEIVTTDETGAYSHIDPGETVHYYVEVTDINRTAAYVYYVDNNRFPLL